MGNFQFTNWIPSPLTHKDFVPTHFSSFSCSINFPFTVINPVWEKRHNFPWPPGFPSIIILFLFPTFSRCIFITPRLHCLTSYSLSLSLFFPCSVFNPSKARFSSCQPSETSHGRVTKPRLPQVVTSFLKHFLHLASEAPNSLGFHWLYLHSLICLLLLSASSIPSSGSNLIILGAPGLSLEFFFHSSQMISWLLKLSTCSWFPDYTLSPR